MSLDSAKLVKKAIRESKDSTPEKAAIFFKTDPGEYAAHEKFIGVTVPTLRKVAAKAKSLPLSEVETLLASSYNEEKLIALIILICQFRTNQAQQATIAEFYLSHRHQVNNWNLVDASAHTILGAYLLDKDKSVLMELIESKTLWDRRIAMVATWAFIKAGDLSCTFDLAQRCCADPEDLMHKAAGWMLREAGKKDEQQLKVFIDTHWAAMPRVMLRYAIERFPPEERRALLSKGKERA